MGARVTTTTTKRWHERRIQAKPINYESLPNAHARNVETMNGLG